MNWKAITGIMAVLILCTGISTARANRIEDCIERVVNNFNNLSEEEQREIDNIEKSTSIMNCISLYGNTSIIGEFFIVMALLYNLYRWCKIVCA